ncbi:hypothetical protein [Acinetobacter baumannii]|uniref:hypothetical protein n=1 Tax=Acinetobacter baumannii TaxID=470 RepID=UPI0018972B15|nr:hypothetical protein [Acinetobacter baumannii]MBF6841920.1 hypothetical protein [Acinetobacter baumannii]
MSSTAGQAYSTPEFTPCLGGVWIGEADDVSAALCVETGAVTDYPEGSSPKFNRS